MHTNGHLVPDTQVPIGPHVWGVVLLQRFCVGPHTPPQPPEMHVWLTAHTEVDCS